MGLYLTELPTEKRETDWDSQFLVMRFGSEIRVLEKGEGRGEWKVDEWTRRGPPPLPHPRVPEATEWSIGSQDGPDRNRFWVCVVSLPCPTTPSLYSSTPSPSPLRFLILSFSSFFSFSVLPRPRSLSTPPYPLSVFFLSLSFLFLFLDVPFFRRSFYSLFSLFLWDCVGKESRRGRDTRFHLYSLFRNDTTHP